MVMAKRGDSNDGGSNDNNSPCGDKVPATMMAVRQSKDGGGENGG